MPVKIDQLPASDAGLFALVILLRFHGLGVDAGQVRQRFGKKIVGVKQMVRCARDLGLRTRVRVTKWDLLSKIPLPGIAALRDGGFVILGKVAGDTVLVQHPTSSSQLQTITRAQFEAIWNGRLVVMTRRSSPSYFAERLVRKFAEISETIRSLVQRGSTFLTRLWPRGVESSIDISTEVIAHEAKAADDSGLAALVMLLRIHGIGADPEQIRHRCGMVTVGVNQMLRCAKELGLKARISTTSWERLSATPLPGIAALRDGGFLILGKVADEAILVQLPSSPKPEAMTRAQLEAIWDGRLVLMAR